VKSDEWLQIALSAARFARQLSTAIAAAIDAISGTTAALFRYCQTLQKSKPLAKLGTQLIFG
jgi:hypothetical protein